MADDRNSKTIKGMDEGVWNEAVAVAKARGESMAAFTAWAFGAACRLHHAGPMIVPPDERPPPAEVAPPPSSVLGELAQAMQAAAAVAQASGIPMPRRHAQRAYRALDNGVRATLGMAPASRRRPPARLALTHEAAQ